MDILGLFNLSLNTEDKVIEFKASKDLRKCIDSNINIGDPNTRNAMWKRLNHLDIEANYINSLISKEVDSHG